MCRIFNIIFISFFLCSFAEGQNAFNKTYFEKTIWASLNKDSLFFKLDTIKMVKINKKLPLNDKNIMQVDAFFNENNYVTLNFKKHKKLELSSYNVRAWMRTTKVGTYNWMFKNIDKSINLFFEGKLFASFVPIYENQTWVPSSHTDIPIQTTEITLIRVR